ncbi:NmrA family transcriptional regulator [Frateuria sp. Soil773]|uniref:NmrA family NAD(P)-binding protein n=1 Tax=Frateuria sp. Soil773 TaxID=1736407 RepID=UPI0006FCE506|nr:NAD(P)H-binding protein [Frateuria sp. Soil773]KRE89887.1 NmrA family transcriptional regulator [Frateuria sp. Soil773]
MTDTTQTTLVLGSSGKTGRRIVERLRARRVAVRGGSRSGEPRFDWEDRGTWAGALRGVSSAYVSYYPDLAAPGAADAIAAFAAQALDLGVRRLVLLSGRGEEEAQNAERALQASGTDWTVLRCSWFMQNFSESFFLDPLLAGTLALPVGDVPEPFVDADDIADVAVAALTDDRHLGQVLELTGPRALSFAQAVAEIARASGRELHYQLVSMDAYAAEAVAQGMPQEIVGFLGYLFTEVLDGRNAKPTGDIERALGRKPRDFADFARDAAAVGVWAAGDAKPDFVR